MKNIYIDTELVLPMYNVHPYFSLKNLSKKCSLYMTIYGNPHPETFDYTDKNCTSLPTCMALGRESSPWSSRQNYEAHAVTITLPTRTLRPCPR